MSEYPRVIITFDERNQPEIHEAAITAWQRHAIGLRYLMMLMRDSLLTALLFDPRLAPHFRPITEDDHFSAVRRGLRMMASTPEGQRMGMSPDDFNHPQEQDEEAAAN